MSSLLHVAIVDDHQSIIDGYLYRLESTPGIEVVGYTHYGEQVEPLLGQYNVNVLLLDAQIPTSPDNPEPYPVFLLLPKLLEMYPDLHVLIISMHNQRSFIEYAMESGASGYILKDDYGTLKNLDAVVRLVASGGIHYSKNAHRPILKQQGLESQKLTKRQLEALSLCVAYPNETTATLAQQLGVAHSTMRNLLSGAYLSLGVRNRAAAIAEARRQGLIP